MKSKNIRQFEHDIKEEDLEPLRNLINNGLKDKIENPLNHNKETITIDYDNINEFDLLFYYVKCLTLFANDIKDVKKILDRKADVKIDLLKSSSKRKGYHLTINYPNNFIENLYIRTLLGDDTTRILKDIKRLNRENLEIDRVFIKKSVYTSHDNKKKTYIKKYEKQDILKLTNINRLTLFKLFKAIKNQDLDFTEKFYNHNKKYFFNPVERLDKKGFLRNP